MAKAPAKKTTGKKKSSENFLDSFSRPIEAALVAENITLQRLAQQLSAELDAFETKFFAHQGEVINVRDVIAWDVRARARMDAQKLLGLYPAEQHDHQGGLEIVLRDCVKEAGDGD